MFLDNKNNTDTPNICKKQIRESSDLPVPKTTYDWQ